MNGIFKTSVLLNYVTIEYVKTNWLCNHSKKVGGTQAGISVNNCIELSKTQFSLWVSLSNF